MDQLTPDQPKRSRSFRKPLEERETSPPEPSDPDDSDDGSSLDIAMPNDAVGSSTLYLPAEQKLKGEENYLIWKPRLLNLAKANNLSNFLNAKAIVPLFADEFDGKTSAEAVKL